MSRASRSIRTLALTAAVLLLWCHGLDFAFMAHSSGVPAPAGSAAATAFAPIAPAPPDEPVVGCCFGGSGANLLSIAPTTTPQLPAPVLAAMLALSLLLVAPRPTPSRARRLAPHHASLVAQSVLIRI